MEKTKILMVCMGNICRSPLAEAVTRQLAERAGIGARLLVDSAGTLAYHAGEAPDLRAQQAAARRGYELKGMRARRVTLDDFASFDLILAMDRDNLSALKRACPGEFCDKLGLFMDHARDVPGGAVPSEIPDPYYGGPEGFERVLDLCEAAARGLVETLVGRDLERTPRAR